MTSPDCPAEIHRWESQSAFVRGFIDDISRTKPRLGRDKSQSAFVRGFIDDTRRVTAGTVRLRVSIRVRARLHR